MREQNENQASTDSSIVEKSSSRLGESVNFKEMHDAVLEYAFGCRTAKSCFSPRRECNFRGLVKVACIGGSIGPPKNDAPVGEVVPKRDLDKKGGAGG